jgi:hypothetical protein
MAFTNASTVPRSSFIYAAQHALPYSFSFAFIGG